MSLRSIIAVGFNKHGEPDFEVSSAVYDLAPEQLNDLAAMAFAAFHAAYGMRECRGAVNTGEAYNDHAKAKAEARVAGTAGNTGQART